MQRPPSSPRQPHDLHPLLDRQRHVVGAQRHVVGKGFAARTQHDAQTQRHRRRAAHTPPLRITLLHGTYVVDTEPLPPPPAHPAGAPEIRLALGREGWYPPVTWLKAATFVAPPIVAESP